LTNAVCEYIWLEPCGQFDQSACEFAPPIHPLECVATWLCVNFFHRFDHQELLVKLHLNLHPSVVSASGFNVVLEFLFVDSNCVGVMAYCLKDQTSFSFERTFDTPYCTGVLEPCRVHSNE
jgi:hypothetical protein